MGRRRTNPIYKLGVVCKEYHELIKDIRQKIRSDNKETRIIAALELAAYCQYFDLKELTCRFVVDLIPDDVRIMKELIPDVKEYLENHNTANLSFCPMRDGEPISERLAAVHVDNIHTYEESVNTARDEFRKHDGESWWMAWQLFLS